MKLNQLSLIKSERGLRSVVSALWFGSKGAVLTAAANFNGINDTVKSLDKAGYADRAENIRNGLRYQTLETQLKSVALRAASLSAFADSHGIALDIDMAPEIQRGKDEKQLAAVSEASGIPVETIKAKEMAAIKRRYDQQVDAQLMAEAEFYSAAFDEEVEFKTETVLNALVRQRDYMLEWANLDLGELVILKHDIELVEKMLLVEQEKEEASTDGSIDALIGEKSMTQLNQEHQADIAALRGDKPKRGSKTHRVAAH